MADFSEIGSYRNFERSVRFVARYIHEKPVQKFLSAIRETARNRICTLPTGTQVFRAQRAAQRGPDWLRVASVDQDVDCEIEVDGDFPAARERMVPDPKLVGGGRLNPPRIAYFYLATTESAAIAEMRPWVGDHITLARLVLTRDCTVVDCTLDTMESSLREPVPLGPSDGEPLPPVSPEDKEIAVWGDVGNAMSRSVSREDSALDYVPTQVIAEALRQEGYDGIRYRSLLDEGGSNLALFDLRSATVDGAPALYQVAAAEIRIARVDPPSEWPPVPGNPWPDSISSKLKPILLNGL